MTPTEWGILIVLGVLWGGSYFYNVIALRELTPIDIVTFRVVVGAALLWLIARAGGQTMPRDRRIWGWFFGMGALNNVVPFTLIAWSQSHVASGLAAILNATTPLFAVLVAHYATHDEKMTPARVGGLVIGFVGVVIMIGPDVIAGADKNVLAELALLLASIFYAVSVVYGRRFSRAGLRPLVTAAGQFTASSIMMVPICLIAAPPWMLAVPSISVWLALLGLAVISTTLAYVLYYRLLATAGAVNLMLVTFLVPVSAILLGALFLNEHLAANHFLGMAAIGLGLAAIDGRPLRALSRRFA